MKKNANSEKIVFGIIILAGVLALLQLSGFLGASIPFGQLGGNIISIGNTSAFGYTFENYASYSGTNNAQYQENEERKGYYDVLQPATATGVINKDTNGFLTLSVTSVSTNLDREVELQGIYSFLDIKNLQEIIIILDGNSKADRGRDSGSSQQAMFGFGIASSSTLHPLFQSQSDTDNNMGHTDSQSTQEQPSAYKLINNYDGSYTVWKGLNVGDVYLKQGTITLSGTDAIIYFYANAKTQAGGGSNANSYSTAAASMRILTIITKKNEIAQCNAAQTPVTDGNGKIVGCIDSASLKLFKEPSLLESYNETIARITQRLDNQQAYYQTQIADLQAQIRVSTSDSEIADLQAQIADLQTQLVNVPAAKQQVINSINNNSNSSPNLNWYIIGGFIILGFIILRFI